MAGVFARRGVDAWVFRGDDGLDELTTTTTSRVWAVARRRGRRSTPSTRRRSASAAGPPRACAAATRPTTPTSYAACWRASPGPVRDAVRAQRRRRAGRARRGAGHPRRPAGGRHRAGQRRRSTPVRRPAHPRPLGRAQRVGLTGRRVRPRGSRGRLAAWTPRPARGAGAAEAALPGRPGRGADPAARHGDFSDDGVTATVQGWAGPVRAGPARGDRWRRQRRLLRRHAARGAARLRRRDAAQRGHGDGARDPVGATLRADGVFDARGTLGLDREVPVGVRDVRRDRRARHRRRRRGARTARRAHRALLRRGTERCATPPQIVVRRR